MELSKIEIEAQALYDANKKYVESVSEYLSTENMIAFAKEQDRLHLLICEEQDKRLGK